MTLEHMINAIGDSIATGGVVKLETMLSESATEDMAEQAWAIFTCGGGVDYIAIRGAGPDGETVLDMWGWSVETPANETEWRLIITLLEES